jgi:uroporphyrinogen decarboxylase
MTNFEKIFSQDQISKRERIERAFAFQALDRAPLHEQLSYNSQVISHYTGKDCSDFHFTAQDVGETIRKTMDSCFIPMNPKGTDQFTDEFGFVLRNDNWTTWYLSRPFTDEIGAKEWLEKKIKSLKNEKKNLNRENQRKVYRAYMEEIQSLIGDTVHIDWSIGTGFCAAFDAMGLETYIYFSYDYPDVLQEYMEISCDLAVEKVEASADLSLSPVVLIAEDFSTKGGPIFNAKFLDKYHFPYVKRLAQAWHNHGIKVLYHSDGNYKSVIPNLIACEVDGFYCLEPNCGMEVVSLVHEYPQMVWAGGVDGVDLMERGTPDQVKKVVTGHIIKTNVLQRGGMLVATSSEINPPIQMENFVTMVETVGSLRNEDFGKISL